MKRIFQFILLSTLPLLGFSQINISGTVYDAESQEVLPGANLYILNSYLAGSSDQQGGFSFTGVKKEELKLVISYIGYQKDSILVNAQNASNLKIYLKPGIVQSDEVIVQSTRANKLSPVAKSLVDKEEITENNMGADIPYLLQQGPSVVSTSDAGAGIGYTGIRIRGSDASRINVTVNGIPINDAESHGVFWVNMPDLASSLESIQIQRGLGTSTNGAGAFGASINLETNLLNEKAYGEINNSFGSFNTRKNTVKIGSGLINDHFAFEGRLSSLYSDGYIDRASADLNSYFLSGAYYGEKTIIKALTFGGKEITYQSWYGTPEARLENDREALETHISNEGYPDDIANNLRNSDRRYNHYLYDNQVDNYGQDHYQLHFSHAFSQQVQANLALHYTKGEGYFEEFRRQDDLSNYNLNDIELLSDTIRQTDLVRRRWLDNDFYGMTYAVNYKANKSLNFNLGGGVNRYEGDHFGEIIWAQYPSNSFLGERYYFNKGEKTDANSYLKTDYQLNSKLALFLDLQVRLIDYEASGTDNDLREIKVNESYEFFNPKFGFNYELSQKSKISLLLAQGSREPNRADLVDQDSSANKAETMRNLELGFNFTENNYKLGINLYYMDYKDQLINTGRLNDVGSPIRQNVDKSYRRGIEITGAVALSKKLQYQANISLSQNKIESFTEVIYDYTNGFEVIENKKGETDISFSPNVIANGELVYQPLKGLEFGLQTRYVGEQYLDNTSNENRKLDAYLVSDLRAEYTIPFKWAKEVRLMARVNNLFDEEYSSNGYSYSYIYGATITENFYYPQATRNYLIGLNLRF